ncbi:CDP-alcohol phosphatidyltransferase family protein [Marisediminicola sp. LYQ85]|uniref:CDP-alcohol phosphatidyltransferase family protein n=1 Tax=Marisediminicola sp. LYQ85 TaxID=3391062 RepID=UPI003983397A
MVETPSPESFGATVRRLSSAQKKRAPGAPPYSIYVNRPVGRIVAAAAYRAGLTPNHVTLLSAGLTFAGIAIIATVPPLWWTGLVVWFLLALGYAFDSADGQVARLRGGGSPAGEWLDHVVDSAKTVSLHVAVAIAVYRFFPFDDAWALIPLGFAIVATVSFFAMILNDLLKTIHGSDAPRSGREPSALRSLLLIPTDYGIHCAVFVLLSLPVVFLSVYGLLFVACAGHLALALNKWFGDMGALHGRVSTNV